MRDFGKATLNTTDRKEQLPELHIITKFAFAEFESFCFDIFYNKIEMLIIFVCI